MIKHIAVLLLCMLVCSCNGQAYNAEKSTELNTGIVYFSYDNGVTWKNTSEGIPQKVRIGLGGIAVSSDLLGIATKEYGVYLYDSKTESWANLTPNEQMIKDNIGSLFFFKNDIFVGTQFSGVFYSDDTGKTWTLKNTGLGSLTIRRFAEIENKLYGATNSGLYAYDEAKNEWKLEFGHQSLQVNGITKFEESIYIATNEGVFKSDPKSKKWVQVLPNHSVHNISSDDNTLYAMTYNALLLSSFDGTNWQSIQAGLPENLYTFNVEKKGNTVFAGQWDGIYSKNNSTELWKKSSKGLPEKFATTNLKIYKDILVVSTSERKLK